LRKTEAGSSRADLGDVDRRTHAITFVVEQGRRQSNLTTGQHAKAPRRPVDNPAPNGSLWTTPRLPGGLAGASS